MADHTQAPIIIKKKKKGAHDEHSSAWKIALADFMTALMCFFLVMWLTTMKNTDTKSETGKFFLGAGIDENDVGVGGLLGGATITADGPLSQASAAFSVTPPMGAEEENESELLGRYLPEDEQRQDISEAIAPHTLEDDIAETDDTPKDQTASHTLEDSLHQKKLEDLAHTIQKDVAQLTGDESIEQQVNITQTTEGVRIDFLDSYEKPMFRLGSHHLMPQAKKLIAHVVKRLESYKTPLSIIGHTDNRHYQNPKGYTNWDLSSDRAHEARRLIQEQAPTLPITAVVGKAAADLYDEKNPLAPANRRISLIANTSVGRG